MLSRALRASLALRLALLYALATAVLLIVLGAGLAWVLRTQLEMRDREEIDGKTEQVLRTMRELGSTGLIETGAERIVEAAIGHPHLRIGLRRGSRWLVPLPPELAGPIGPDGNDHVPHLPEIGRYRIGKDNWWLRRVDYIAPDDRIYAAYLALHVNPTQELVRALMWTMVAAGIFGMLASAAVGGWVARRGLAPLSLIAHEAERVTADRLGEVLPAHDAPAELRGLVTAINRMLQRLRESFRSLEEFSADLAHELRTPISNLMLQTQVTLSRPRSADEYREALHSNLAELERLQRMVVDMLFLARADKGMLELKLEPIDLAREALNVAEFFEPATAEAQQHIAIEGAAIARCDRSMARRAITNLISNAVRYSPPGASIMVRAAQSANDARLEVENPAAPRSPDELRRLFARFDRGRFGGGIAAEEVAADGADRAGLGLGLSIVESIMRLHGGRVTAESGTFGVRFSLVFPLRDVSRQTGASPFRLPGPVK
jgi:two-component system heavy metal sensor histidine kinase CusS